MAFESPIFYIVMGLLTILGLAAAAIYYFARFTLKTDHDQDIKKIDEAGLSEADKIKSELEALKLKQLSEEVLHTTIGIPSTEQAPAAKAPEVPRKKELSEALSNTKESLWGRIRKAFSGAPDGQWDEIEEILYTSDLGPQTVQRLLGSSQEGLSSSDRSNPDQVRAKIKSEMLKIFEETPSNPADDVSSILGTADHKPLVLLVVGVNGAGKTTTIGKLSHALGQSGKKVLVAAGDTFRAAAGAQLKAWTDRAQVEIFHPEGVTDPSAVAFDAVQKGYSKGFDVVIIDTAGRLHTQVNLMEELRKMKRVVQKVIPDAPHEVWLVLDANSGQNALHQAKFFNEAIEVTGVVLTKLDGTAKGGVALGLACEQRIPIRMIGVGEGIEDLRPFRAAEFVESIF